MESGRSAPPPASSKEAQGGGKLANVAGFLGLVEVGIFVVYVIGEPAHFTSTERVVLTTLAMCEIVGVFPMGMALFYMCGGIYGAMATGRLENTLTLTRDPLHNLVYPRSAPGSQPRRDFSILAMLSLLLNSAWVLLFLSFYAVWGKRFGQDPLAIRIFPSVMALLSILGTMVGSRSIENNQSSYILTAMYLNSKIVSVVVLLSAPDRLLMGDDVPDLAVVLGIPLVCLQVIKICSAAVAMRRYHAGTPDEKLPDFTLLRLFDLLARGCFFLANVGC